MTAPASSSPFPRSLGLWLGLLLSGSAGAQETFYSEVTDEAFAAPQFGMRSTAFGDYDNDGWPDFFASEVFGPRSVLVHNEGNGRFADLIATSIQGNVTQGIKGGGAIFGDYDNDGDLDLYVPQGSFGGQRIRNLLLRNDRGLLRDVSLEVGLIDSLSTDNAIWLDYDRNGFLDLYTGNVGRLEMRVTDSTATRETVRLRVPSTPV